jgi:hypothetical protein
VHTQVLKHWPRRSLTSLVKRVRFQDMLPASYDNGREVERLSDDQLAEAYAAICLTKVSASGHDSAGSAAACAHAPL